MNENAMVERLRTLLAQVPPEFPFEDRLAAARAGFEKGERLRSLLERHPSPLWVLDRAALREKARRFRETFEAALPRTGFFFAMKSNNHPEVSRTLVESGFALDVSSGVELETALSVGAREIVFSGPGKRADELDLALANADRVTVLMDSFLELERLEAAAGRAGRAIRAGVRITPPPPNRWRKFGVALERLREFWEMARACRRVRLRGIQFHTSWNLDPSAQEITIRALGDTLAGWPQDWLRDIEFLDIGGGFWPSEGEWLLHAATDRGRAEDLLGGLDPAAASRPVRMEAQPLAGFARRLAAALGEHIFPRAGCRVCFEPGRWVCNEALHLFLTVMDMKAPDLAITDAGTNAIGWERFESDYSPIVNLSRPALEERRCEIMGSLCTPHDYWGFACWGGGIEPGDVLFMANLGAYTWSLRQHFIKPLPEVVVV